MNDHDTHVNDENATPSAIHAEWITPEIAEKWLAGNTRNRRVNPSIVAQYSRDMVSGEWEWANGDPVRFASDGTLLDGQHRLHAVVHSTMPQWFYVKRDVRLEGQARMDTGRKRSAGDALGIAGINADGAAVSSTALAAAAKLCLTFDAGRLAEPETIAVFERTQITHSAILDYVESHPLLVESVARNAGRTKTGLTPAVRVAGWFVLARVDRDLATEFFDALEAGSRLETGDPVLILRDALAAASSGRKRLSNPAQLSMVVRAWNAWRNEGTLSRLIALSRGGKPIACPQPI